MEPSLEKKPLKAWSDQERIQAVKQIFNTITPNYDLLNHIMSARQDIKWRRVTANRIPQDAVNVLDIATGTGDLALAIAQSRPKTRIFGVDFVEAMMRQAVEKTRGRGLLSRVSYSAGDAMALPFRDGMFDAASMAFGLRNMPDRPSAIKEMVRVVKPGGKILILEMTFPRSFKLRQFFTWYLNKIIPILGSAISGNRAAYTYLPDSIQDFLHPDDLTALFNEAGIVDIHTRPFMFGLTYLHEGRVP